MYSTNQKLQPKPSITGPYTPETLASQIMWWLHVCVTVHSVGGTKFCPVQYAGSGSQSRCSLYLITENYTGHGSIYAQRASSYIGISLRFVMIVSKQILLRGTRLKNSDPPGSFFLKHTEPQIKVYRYPCPNLPTLCGGELKFIYLIHISIGPAYIIIFYSLVLIATSTVDVQNKMYAKHHD